MSADMPEVTIRLHHSEESVGLYGISGLVSGVLQGPDGSLFQKTVVG